MKPIWSGGGTQKYKEIARLINITATIVGVELDQFITEVQKAIKLKKSAQNEKIDKTSDAIPDSRNNVRCLKRNRFEIKSIFHK